MKFRRLNHPLNQCTENASKYTQIWFFYCSGLRKTFKKMAFYPYFLLALSSMGMASNVVSLFFFARQRFRRNFHRLLVILAIYDFMVRSFELNIHTLFFLLCFKCKITDTLFSKTLCGNSCSCKGASDNTAQSFYLEKQKVVAGPQSVAKPLGVIPQQLGHVLALEPIISPNLQQYGKAWHKIFQLSVMPVLEMLS